MGHSSHNDAVQGSWNLIRRMQLVLVLILLVSQEFMDISNNDQIVFLTTVEVMIQRALHIIKVGLADAVHHLGGHRDGVPTNVADHKHHAGAFYSALHRWFNCIFTQSRYAT